LPESVEHDRATYCPTLATHAKRNPNLFVQPVRKITKLSDAQKASNQLRRKVVQEEHQQLIEEFENLLQQHSQEQEELAKKFGVKPEYLDKLKGTSKHFKVKRSVNIENAKIHKKSIEINGGTLICILYWTALILKPRS
jgi:DNA gyrase/topoisomerase IV subunit A